MKKLKFSFLNGILIALLLVLICFTLSYILMQNPYQSLHAAVLKTADNIREYYRDSPGYWKLDTAFANDAKLIADDFAKHKDIKISVGQGINGEAGLPSNRTFDITLSDLNKSACIGLSEIKISEKNSLGLQKISIITDDATTEFMWGDKKNKLPITKWKTRNICSGTHNKIMWTFQ